MNDHDPMLDGITRYDSDDYDVELPEKPDGIYVLFSDLPALIAKVREDERGKVRDEFESDPLRFMRSYKAGIEQGQRDERERIRTGVTGLSPHECYRSDMTCVMVSTVLAVIDATPCPTCNGNGATGRADDPDTCQACRGRGEL